MTASVGYTPTQAYHPRDRNFHSLPTSQLRTSMKCDDLIDCKEGDTIERRWEGRRSVSIPYQEQTLRNLYGRSVEDSLFPQDSKWGYTTSDEPEEYSRRLDRSERVKEEFPYYLYGPYCPSESKSYARDKENATETMVSRFAAASPFTDESIQFGATTYTEPLFRDHQPHKSLLSRDHWCHDLESTKDVIMSAPEESSFSSLTSSPDSLPPIASLFGSPLLSPKAIGKHSPTSGIQKLVQKENTGTRQLRDRRASPGLRRLSPSEDDEDIVKAPATGLNSPLSTFTSSGEDGGPVEQLPKTKKKASQGPIHHCKQCNITFTRNFDLQRHNQKHKSDRDANEDISRRTCTNCGRVLSRVDAARRHVDTMPDSCNYIKKKESKPLLPVESPEHYALLQGQYKKLADETKKPKGRKKAVVVPPTISI